MKTENLYSEGSGQPWCALHDMHPKDCFELHHPDRFDTPDDIEIVISERDWFMLPCRHLVPVTGETKGKIRFTIECECGKIWDFERTGGELQSRERTPDA